MVKRKRTNGNNVNSRIRALKSDFDGLQKDMRKLMDSLGDAASNGASEMAGSARKVATDALHDAGDYAEQGVETVRSAIRVQPLAAIALSIGAGAILGSLMRRQ